MEEKKNGWVSALIIGISIMVSCASLAFGLSHFRSESTHVITATGSASVDFESDLIIWRGSFSRTAWTSQEAYTAIKNDAELVKTYLTGNGITEDEIVFDSVDIGSQWLLDTCKDVANVAGIELHFKDEISGIDITIPGGNIKDLLKSEMKNSAVLDENEEPSLEEQELEEEKKAQEEALRLEQERLAREYLESSVELIEEMSAKTTKRSLEEKLEYGDDPIILLKKF